MCVSSHERIYSEPKEDKDGVISFLCGSQRVRVSGGENGRVVSRGGGEWEKKLVSGTDMQGDRKITSNIPRQSSYDWQ